MINKSNNFSSRLVLMHRDTEVAKLNRFFDLVSVYSVEHLPYYDTRQFISSRMVPIGTAMYERLRLSLGSSELYTDEVIENTNLASLSDSYWIKFNRDKSWEEVSLYRDFNDSLSTLAFVSNTSAEMADTLKSPAFTATGMLRKCWTKGPNGITLLAKTGSETYRMEPLFEYAYTLVAEALEIETNRIILKTMHGELVSLSENITDEKYGLLPAQFCLYRLQEINNVNSKLDDMYQLDFLTDSGDRHLNNFAGLVDNDTMQIVDVAKLYDNGSSFGACNKTPMFPTVTDDFAYKLRYLNFEEILLGLDAINIPKSFHKYILSTLNKNREKLLEDY